MTVQGDLFADVELPPGLSLWPEFVSPAEEGELERAVDEAPLAPFQFGQWEGKRLTASYGHRYDFGRGRVEPAPPFPAWLAAVAQRVSAVAGGAEFVQGLVIRYDPGAQIGWHRDRPQFGLVAGLSLSSAATLRLRRRTASGFERRSLELPRRSLYLLDGEARWDWEHSIVPAVETRRSVTLRTLRI
jgi:alkylated DNA repair dioxygenase AlkB